MFEHKNLDGEKYRLVSAAESFLKGEVLEFRDGSAEKSPRQQNAVIGEALVERYLPPESIGDVWPHDKAATPWWLVVDHPPHAGIVAEFNQVMGGI